MLGSPQAPLGFGSPSARRDRTETINQAKNDNEFPADLRTQSAKDSGPCREEDFPVPGDALRGIAVRVSRGGPGCPGPRSTAAQGVRDVGDRARLGRGKLGPLRASCSRQPPATARTSLPVSHPPPRGLPVRGFPPARRAGILFRDAVPPHRFRALHDRAGRAAVLSPAPVPPRERSGGGKVTARRAWRGGGRG